MLREEFGLAVHHLGRMGFEHCGDLRVELLPGFAQQATVSCVLHQRVPEGIDRLGRRAALGDQLGADEAAERGLQLFLGETRNRTQ